MRILDAGHEFMLNNLDGTRGEEQTLYFVKREGAGYPGNVGHHSGTTVQEVLRACISRLDYVNNQISDYETQTATEMLKRAIFKLEARAARKHGRSLATLGLIHVPGTNEEMYFTGNIAELLTCPVCGHIGCTGNHKERV